MGIQDGEECERRFDGKYKTCDVGGLNEIGRLAASIGIANAAELLCLYIDMVVELQIKHYRYKAMPRLRIPLPRINVFVTFMP